MQMATHVPSKLYHPVMNQSHHSRYHTSYNGPRLPMTYSTAATLYGQLVIIGGVQSGSLLNPFTSYIVDGKWVEIGSMSSGRAECLVVSLSPDRMMIVGGEQEKVLKNVLS